MADETMLAAACESSEKDRLLALLREHLTVSIEVDRVRWGLDQTVRVQILFDEETVAEGDATLYWPSVQEQLG